MQSFYIFFYFDFFLGKETAESIVGVLFTTEKNSEWDIEFEELINVSYNL